MKHRSPFMPVLAALQLPSWELHDQLLGMLVRVYQGSLIPESSEVNIKYLWDFALTSLMSTGWDSDVARKAAWVILFHNIAPTYDDHVLEGINQVNRWMLLAGEPPHVIRDVEEGIEWMDTKSRSKASGNRLLEVLFDASLVFLTPSYARACDTEILKSPDTPDTQDFQKLAVLLSTLYADISKEKRVFFGFFPQETEAEVRKNLVDYLWLVAEANKKALSKSA